MTAVGGLLLVLGLLVSARCEVRARDPEVEEEEEELRGGRGGGGGGGGRGAFPPHHRATESDPLGETGSNPGRSGNWCTFVQRRQVTKIVAHGKETYIIRSTSPCPNGEPDCHLTLYKVSTRPSYRQELQTVTALLWHCCPGHGGHNCEDTVVEVQPQHQSVDPDREQNDHHVPVSPAYDNPPPTPQNPGYNHKPHQNQHQARNSFNLHQPHHHDHELHKQQLPGEHDLNPEFSYQEAASVLPVPHMMALVMSQLTPVLEGFNRSLDHLSRQVEDLSRDVAQLKSSRPTVEPWPQSLEPEEDLLDAKLDQVFQDIRDVQRQVESQRADMESRLHSQHAMLHYNLTSFKTDVDMKLKRQQKMLQVSLQTVNTTLTQLRLEQDQITEEALDQPPAPPPIQRSPAPDTAALWEAITRLDDMVVNNTVKVGGLMEDVEVASGGIHQLRHHVKELEKELNQTARQSQIFFMETGLEVEAGTVTVLRRVEEVEAGTVTVLRRVEELEAGTVTVLRRVEEVEAGTVRVLRRVEELEANLMQKEERLKEIDSDLDYLWNGLYKRNSSTDCDCRGLMDAVARLERGVANVTRLANDNRVALEENGGGAWHWDGASEWKPAVQALQDDLEQVKASLVLEQGGVLNLTSALDQLSGTVSGLEEEDDRLEADIKFLSVSFKSLLKDAVRHSTVLGLLLGEEVLEFLEWPDQDQEEHSIPALKEQLRQIQGQLRGRDIGETGGAEEVPSADQPSSSSFSSSSSSSSSHPDDWLSGGMRRGSEGVPARERQLLLRPGLSQLGGDGSDLWNLERTVEKLEQRLVQLEQKPCPCPNASTEREEPPVGVEAKLQAEVLWLKRGLEEHLRVFKNVFSNADVLARSDATLELDKLWQLLKNRERKEKKRGGREEAGRGGRRRRDSSGVPALSDQSGGSLLFVAASPLSVSDNVLMFQSSLNRQVYSDLGVVTAPTDGVYLFVLTLHMRPGPAHVVLRRGEEGGALVSLYHQEVMEAGPVTGVGLLVLREGEELSLELRRGEWVESENNAFAGLLLH